MEDNLIIGAIIAVVFGQQILAVIFPKAGRSSVARLGFGALQVMFGLSLSVALAHEGYVWKWPVSIALLGTYNLWIGWGLHKAHLRRARRATISSAG